MSVTELGADLRDKLDALHAGGRYLLGIAGCPASGKSTFATALARDVNRLAGAEIAVVVPMDGFHLPNDVLEARGIRYLKGVPETFDPDGFCDLLKRLRRETNSIVRCPEYSRLLHSPVPDAIAVRPVHTLLIVEGNYLLLDTGAWSGVRPLLDEVWYVEVDEDVMRSRLLERHMAGGRTPEEAARKVEETDWPNAKLVSGRAHAADRMVNLDPSAELAQGPIG